MQDRLIASVSIERLMLLEQAVLYGNPCIQMIS
jgi:hypothetical protein